ncbi:MAG: GNAT family N-acetyltransferase [Chloroflexi bacterium]|nr:GNAT family N-acetyltransferase [Chloroflexota bacterium]
MTAQVKAIVSRSYEGDDDFWSIRNFLIETYPIAPPVLNWEVRRWDGQRFHRENLDVQADWQHKIHLWEMTDGRVVGVVHPEGSGDAFLQIHPNFRFLEDEMLDWAEKHRAVDGLLCIVGYEHDTQRLQLLSQRGYQKTPSGFVTRRISLATRTVSPVEIAKGYRIRTTGPADCAAIANLLNVSFGRDCHTAGEYKNFTTHSPSFDHALNYVAETPDGSLAAHVGINFIPENNYAVFEPVCTHPDHRRKGLGLSLMLAGLRQLKQLEVDTVFVDTGDGIAANKLYDTLGFDDTYQGYEWVKVL